MSVTARTFYIRQSAQGPYLSRRDEWTSDVFGAMKLIDLAAVRHNIERLRLYDHAVYTLVGGAGDDQGRWNALDELFR